MAVDQPIIFVVDEIVLRRAIARIIDVRTWHDADLPGCPLLGRYPTMNRH
jgi:hypothetical protein